MQCYTNVAIVACESSFSLSEARPAGTKSAMLALLFASVGADARNRTQ